MKSIRHTGIVVRDIEKAIRFYKDILGLKIKHDVIEKGSYIDRLFDLKAVRVRIIKLSADDGNLVELLCFESHPRKSTERAVCDIGYSHISFTVEDIESEYSRLKGKGIKFNHIPLISPNGRAKVVYCRDPEDNFVELVEELEG